MGWFTKLEQTVAGKLKEAFLRGRNGRRLYACPDCKGDINLYLDMERKQGLK